MNYKFPRKLHLTNKKQFKRVFRARKKVTTEIINIYCHNNESKYPRLGIIISKKSIKKASKRSFFKRIIRETFRLKQHEFRSIDIVIFVNSKAETLLRKEFVCFLNKELDRLQ